jgi:hypothetical protein
MKPTRSSEPIVALLAGAALVVIGMSTAYPTGFGGVSSAAYAAGPTTLERVTVPFDDTLFVPCAAGGAGEEVHFTGTFNLVGVVVEDPSGGTRFVIHENSQDLSGTGLTTGDNYRKVQTINFEFIINKVGVEESLPATFNLIGQGNGIHVFVHLTQHATVNADGTVTSFFDKTTARVECK